MDYPAREDVPVSELRAQLGRRLLLPNTPRYDEARQIWNAMHDRRPAFICRCLTAAEVSLAVRHAVAAGFPVTVRGGGHNVAGLAVADDAVMIDLSLMRRVTVDPAARLARAQGGCLLRDLDAATAPYGLACPAGVVSHTGLGGLALGGGYGWLAAKWGLTCDHIASAEVVLADGSIVEADDGRDGRYGDLLWALRGGGGNFGVVTRFTLRLRTVGPVQHRVGVYPLETAAAALAAYREFAVRQPPDLHAVGTLKYAGEQDWIPAELRHRPALFLSTAWFGDGDGAASALAPLFGPAPPAAMSARQMSYAELQALGDHGEPHGNRYFTKSCYLADLPPAAIAELLDSAKEIQDPRSSIDFEYLRGAITNISDENSAFPQRAAPYIYTASAQWSDPDLDAENIEWSRQTIGKIRRFQFGGVYVNYVQDETESGTLDIYGTERCRRLGAIKRRYDPHNVFHHNKNIQPTVNDIREEWAAC